MSAGNAGDDDEVYVIVVPVVAKEEILSIVTHEFPLYPSTFKTLKALVVCPLYQKLNCTAAEASSGVSTASPVASILSEGAAAP